MITTKIRTMVETIRNKNNDGQMERYQALRNGYEIKYYIKQG